MSSRGLHRMLCRVVATLWLALPSAAAAEPSAEALTHEGWVELAAGRWSDAQKTFERALARDPSLTAAWLGLGDSLFWQGDYRGCLSANQRALELGPEAHGWASRGHCRLALATRTWQSPERRRRLLDEAEAAFRRSLALDADSSSAKHGLEALALAQALPAEPSASLQAFCAAAMLALLGLIIVHLVRSGPTRSLRRVPRALRAVLPPFVVSRAIVLLGFATAHLWLADAPVRQVPILAPHQSPVLRAVAERWDSNLYVDVALFGYRERPPGSFWGSLGQLPLLPVLYRFSVQLIGDAHIAAFLLPHVALFVAALLLFLVARQRGTDDAQARRIVWVLLLVPGALFGSTLYAEPLALAFLIGAWFALGRSWIAACVLCGMLAGMARINAVALSPMLALEVYARRDQLPRSAWLAPLGPLLGLLAFMVYTHVAFGDAFAYFHELRGHRFAGQGPAPGLRDISMLTDALFEGASRPDGEVIAVAALGVSCLVAYAWAGVDLWRAKQWPEAAGVLTGVALAMGSNLASHGRYLWLLFPACVAFARWTHGRPQRALAGALLGIALFVEASAFSAFYFVP